MDESIKYAMVDREVRMIELKKEVNELCIQNNLPPRYALDFDTSGPEQVLL